MSATTDRDNAIAWARGINDPWFRCQALAWMAWTTPDDHAFRTVIAESLKTAQGAEDPYQRVGASAWPVRALVERHDGAQAISVIQKVLALVPQIENPVSRADALFLLFQAVLPLGSKAIQPVMAALVAVCSATYGWKGQRILHDAALMLSNADGAAASQVVSAIREGRERRQAERQIAEGHLMPPRAFFWQTSTGPTEPSPMPPKENT